MEAYTIDEISGHTVMSKMRSLAKQCTEFMNEMNNSMSRMYIISNYTIDGGKIKISRENFKVGVYFISLYSIGSFVIDVNSLTEHSNICIGMNSQGTRYSYFRIDISGTDDYVYFTLMESIMYSAQTPISFEISSTSLANAQVKLMTSINEQESE